MELVGLAAVLAVVGLVIATAMRKARARAAARAQTLADSGFRACDAEAERLRAIASELRDVPRLALRKPWKCATPNGSIYWYEVSEPTGADEQRHAADEFLCSLARRSKQPFVLYLAPPGLGNGFGAKVIKTFIRGGAPAGLQEIAVQRSERTEHILAAFGPRGAALGDVLDDDQLAQLAQGARHGVFAIRGRDDHCALELYGEHARRGLGPVAWEDCLAFVRKIAV
jgi:hypothetical protein